MPDETAQPAPEPTPPETPVSESVSQPTAPSEPTVSASIPLTELASLEVPPESVEAPPSSEDAVPVKDDISANEPLEPAPIPEVPNEPNNPNITIEKNGNDVTITEVMEPNSAEATLDKPTAQMGANESIDLAEELKTKQREENLKLANETRQEKKREKIDKILTLFSEKSQITNDEVEKLLHVSDATATRYLEQLEKEGKIKQVGKTGKGVMYEKI